MKQALKQVQKSGMERENALKKWRKTHGYTQEVFAAILLIDHVKTYQRYEHGENICPAHVAERIKRFTKGEITPLDLHHIRCQWLETHKPTLSFNPDYLTKAAE